MPKKCKQCQSKDPEFRKFMLIQTVSFLCDQGIITVLPNAGIPLGFIRGRCSWWTEFV
jgi:hypothetical protein